MSLDRNKLNLALNNQSKESALPEISEIDFNCLEDKQFKPFFLQLQKKLDKFSKDWNADEGNRDKTIGVFNKLTETKEEIQDSLKLMLERDGKIEDSLARG